MLQKIVTSICFSILFLTISNVNIIAASGGKITGRVNDGSTGEALVGANVILLGTSFGAATDNNGNYNIVGIPPGKYTLMVSYIGYQSKSEKVEIKYSETHQLDFKLNYGAVEGKTVTVTAQAVGQAEAINRQLNSDIISNIVSSDKILALPDVNAAEAVGRLPGMSIIRSGGEGNEIVVRGLSPQYNLITINGVRVSATDLDNNSVDVSMISPDMLSGIEVKKTLTPDMDADAIGGTVDFELQGAKAGGFHIQARMNGTYNALRTDAGNYNGFVKLNSRFWNDKLGVIATGNVERIQRGADQYNADYLVVREKHPGESYAPMRVDRVNLQYTNDVRERKDFSAILDYKLPQGKIMLNSVMSVLDRDDYIYVNDYNYSANPTAHYRRFEETQTETTIFQNSFTGNYDLNSALIDWGLSSSNSYQRIPFDNSIAFGENGAFDVASLPANYTPHDLVNSAYNNFENTFMLNGDLSRNHSVELQLAAKLNIKIPYTINEQISGYLKFGGSYRETSKNRASSDSYGNPFTNDTLSNTPNFFGTTTLQNWIDPNFNTGNFLDGKYSFGPVLSASELNQYINNYAADSLYHVNPLALVDDYGIDQGVSAGYLMGVINLGKYIMLLPGVRYEYTNAHMTGRIGNVASQEDQLAIINGSIRDTSTTIFYANWFPGVNMKIKPTDWFDIRLAFTKSLSRPAWNWLVPKMKINGVQYTVTIGNPYLQPQLSTNYDLYLSFYGNSIGLFTTGAFYKAIRNLIYQPAAHFINTVVEAEKLGDKNLRGFELYKPINDQYLTKVKGMEFDWQAGIFRLLPSPFNGIVLDINYTHIWSSTQYPISGFRRVGYSSIPFDTVRGGEMIDQPADILNCSIGYELGNFSGRYSLLFQGKTLRGVGDRPENDSYTANLLRMDLSVNYSITPKLKIFYSVNNVTNEPDARFQEIQSYITSQQYYGMTMTFGLGYAL